MPSPAVNAHLSVPLLGVSTGLRSFTALAVTAWFARTGELPVEGTWASWVGHPASVGLFTAAALGEYVGDKLPSTPSRTAPLGLVGRLVCGGLVGAIVATALKRPVVGGIAMGAVGAIAGTYGGFAARRGLTTGSGMPDLPVALVEDGISVAMAVGAMRQLTA